MSTTAPPSPALFGELPAGPARQLILRALDAQNALKDIGTYAPPRVAAMIEPILALLQELTLFTIAGAEVTARCREEIEERVRQARSALETADRHDFAVSEMMRGLFTTGGVRGEIS